jgi:peptidoglycan/LPS O-acetylase OafA/YrhL
MHSTKNIHIPSLNGIRAVSVLLVTASHCGFGNVIPGGLGVTIFFFLSGYLITTLLSREFSQTKTISLKSFYLRRLLRLSPPFIITLAVAASLVTLSVLSGGVTLQGMLAQLFYFANYYAIYFDPSNNIPAGTGVFWSLSVEEHFYFIYPIIFLFLMRNFTSQRVAAALWSICIIVLLWRVNLVLSPGFRVDRTYLATDTRIDSIIYGCLLAILRNPLDISKRPRELIFWSNIFLLIGFLGLFISLVIRSELFRETFRYSLQGLALIPIFYAVVARQDGVIYRFLNCQIIDKIGEISYSFYLCHFIIVQLILENTDLGKSRFILFGLVFLASTAYALIINRAIERPLGGFRRKLSVQRLAI